MRAALLAVVAVVLSGATAKAATDGTYVIRNGDTVLLAGTHVGCAAAGGKYGAVLVCERVGSPLKVWIGQNEVFLSRGSITNPDVVASYNHWNS